MRTVLVTVEDPSGTTDLELPLDVPIGELLPALAAACSSLQAGVFGMGGLSLALGAAEGGAFSTEHRLADCGVVDGMRLLLQEETAWRRGTRAAGSSPLPADVPSSTQTGGIGIRWNRDI